uniref:non-specific serine/threonine protein kinase n=1 Tax=Quercus lobata TaxID=97700 RepID=A0A7N2QXP6_QUELO
MGLFQLFPMATILVSLHFLIIFYVSNIPLAFAQNENQFIYNGFHPAKLHLDGSAQLLSNGLLQLTNIKNISSPQVGHVFYQFPSKFNTTSSCSTLSISFSTNFVFAIVPQVPSSGGGHGMTFTISPSWNFIQAGGNQYLGLFNSSNDGLLVNHILAIELDTILNPEFGDIDSNHVGIDVNSLNSTELAPAMYFSNKEGKNKSLELTSGNPMHLWIDYDEAEKLLNVTQAPTRIPKPNWPLMSKPIDLSQYLLESMYVGFSATTGTRAPSDHYILGWSFNRSVQAQSLDVSKLPSLPRQRKTKEIPRLMIMVFLIAVTLVLITITRVAYIIRRKKYEEIREDWEREYGPHRFIYKNLYKATKGFSDKELLGEGGFGKVYRGILPSSNVQIAVKRVSHNSKQGMKEFVAEIISMGRLRHRNLVQLLGYCWRRGELLLVVLHRDVKASNVLLDAELNGRLGDFGLAKLYDHSTNPQTTHVVGTVGYLAPEIIRTRRATTCTDVFSFGAFMLEVACGKWPVGLQGLTEDIILDDWVFECWRRGAILDASDPRLEGNYVVEEMELVLKLGLLCSHTVPTQGLA